MNRRAFTLLEILISVVVLAIGLVGAVAIFPATIDLQRRAQDAVIGQASATSAEAQLKAALLENESVNWLGDTNDWESFYGGDVFHSEKFPPIDLLTRDIGLSVRDARRPQGASGAVLDFLWDVSWEWDRPYVSVDTLDELQSTGNLVIGGGESYRPLRTDPSRQRGADTELPTYELDLASRLMPDASTTANPRYVYDLVVRRVDAGIGTVPRGNRRRYEKSIPIDRLGEVPVQIAVFTRRIDRNVRVPEGVSLRDAFTGDNGVSSGDRRFPLGVDSDNIAQIIPNAKFNDPGVVYSRPLEAFLRGETLRQSDSNSEVFDLFDPQTLRFVDSRIGRDAAVERISQVGQLFVDNQGVVRKVIGTNTQEIDGADRELLVIDPPFSTDNTEVYRQIVFTPQVPVGVRVLTTR